METEFLTFSLMANIALIIMYVRSNAWASHWEKSYAQVMETAQHLKASYDEAQAGWNRRLRTLEGTDVVSLRAEAEILRQTVKEKQNKIAALNQKIEQYKIDNEQLMEDNYQLNERLTPVVPARPKMRMKSNKPIKHD